MYLFYRAAEKHYHKPDGLKKQIYFPTVLEARNLQSGCWHGRVSSEGSRAESALCLFQLL